MSGIILLGGPGSGKTVFLTVFSHIYSNKKNGFQLTSNSKDAHRFCKRNWEVLESGNWPPPTPPGTLAHLEWELSTPKKNIELHAFDYPGEVYKKLFGAEKLSRINPESIKNEEALLLKKMNSSDIFLVLVSLGDLINKSPNDSADTEWEFSNCIDYINKKIPNHHCAVLFTKVDLYEGVYNQCGKSWKNVAEKYIPHIAKKYPDISYFPVAAVSNTVAGNIPNVRLPAKDFTPLGFDPLMNWIKGKSIITGTTKCIKKIAWILLSIILLTFMLQYCNSRPESKRPETPDLKPKQKPKPSVWYEPVSVELRTLTYKTTGKSSTTWDIYVKYGTNKSKTRTDCRNGSFKLSGSEQTVIDIYDSDGLWEYFDDYIGSIKASLGDDKTQKDLHHQSTITKSITQKYENLNVTLTYLIRYKKRQ